jgi:hypothetical protein
LPRLRVNTFAEWLPALFERTPELDEWRGDKAQLQWIFTGPCGGFTVEASAGKVRLPVRHYDSLGLGKVPPVLPRPARHPEGLWEESRGYSKRAPFGSLAEPAGVKPFFSSTRTDAGLAHSVSAAIRITPGCRVAQATRLPTLRLPLL